MCRSADARLRRLPLLAFLLATLTIVLAVGSAGWNHARAETQTISDGATVRAPDRVPAGGKLKLVGRGWTTLGGGGSVIAVKFDDGDVESGKAVVNPATGENVSDPSVVAVIRASTSGRFAASVSLPDHAGWGPGSRHSVRLLTGKLQNDDATRSVALVFDLVESKRAARATPSPRSAASPSPRATSTAEMPTDAPSSTKAAEPAPSVSALAPGPEASEPTSSKPAEVTGGDIVSGTSGSPSPDAGPRSTARAERQVSEAGPPGRTIESSGQPPRPSTSACTQTEPAVTLTSERTVRGVPVADLGGSLVLVGAGFCSPARGGAEITVQIDDGRVVRRDSSVATDRRIWQVIMARDDGSFVARVQLPVGDDTSPAFVDGPHRLRMLTEPQTAGERVRTVRTTEFVVATGNNAGVLPEPTSAPRPVDPDLALMGSKAGGVTVDENGSAARVVVPDLEPGDWVYPYVYRTGSKKPVPVGSWLQLDANRSVLLDPDDVRVDKTAVGSRVSLQARDGSLVGWVPIGTSPAASEPAAEVDVDSDVAPKEQPAPDQHEPKRRPLVIGAGVAVGLIGIASLTHARHRRRRLLSELNGDD